MSAAPMPLDGMLDLAAAEALHRALMAQLVEGGIALDGAAVERVGTPFLQLLAAAARTAQGRQLPFRLHQASAALRAAIVDLGLAPTIPLED